MFALTHLIVVLEYIKPVDTWLSKLYSVLKPLLYKNGGPIITVQVNWLTVLQLFIDIAMLCNAIRPVLAATWDKWSL